MTPANSTSAFPCKPIQKEERGKSSEGKGELPSGANVKDTQVVTADLHEVLPSMCYTLGPVDSQDWGALNRSGCWWALSTYFFYLKFEQL